MKVNLNQAVKGFNGNPLVDESKSVVLIKTLIGVRLFAAGDGLTAEEKYKAYVLMNKISASDVPIELEDEETVLIKKIVEPSVSVGAWGQLVEVLKGGKI